MKKVLSVLFAILLLLPAFAACGESKTNSDPTENPGENIQMPEAEAPAETEPDLYANLPTGDYGGSDFPLLQYEETSAATSTICVEELNGESVNDAIFQRTVNVNERLNITIDFTKTSLSDVTSIMSSSVTAGDDHYQAFWQHSTTAVTNFLQKGYLLTMNGISAFDFEAPWWNRNAMDSIRLNDRIYMAFGDINYYLFDFQSIIICNKPFIENHGMADPYTLVREGEWTIDTFLGMVAQGAEDLNGDGKLGGKQDRIGFTGYKTSTELGFTHAADVELFSRGADGSMVYDGVSEKYFDVVSRYSAVLGDTNYAEHNGDFLGRFRDDLTLFTSCTVGGLSTMRDTEFDYLVLPFPKYDAAQEDYISFITNQIQPMMIPITVADPDRAGVVLENLCGESHKLVRECYFDELVNYKYVRDQDAIDIVRMLYASDARFEIGHIYNWGGVENTITDALAGKGETFISDMTRIEKVMSKSMQKTMDAISG